MTKKEDFNKIRDLAKTKHMEAWYDPKNALYFISMPGIALSFNHKELKEVVLLFKRLRQKYYKNPDLFGWYSIFPVNHVNSKIVCNHCLHETCKDGKNCKGNHTLKGHTEKCVDPYTICCLCDDKTFFPKESVILK